MLRFLISTIDFSNVDVVAITKAATLLLEIVTKTTRSKESSSGGAIAYDHCSDYDIVNLDMKVSSIY